jgi:hypothetical protein
MMNRVERHPLIDDVIGRHRRPGTGPVIGTPLWDRGEAPRPPLDRKRPEIPRTGLSIPALSTGELRSLRSVAPSVATDLGLAERLHSSPLRQTSRSILAATAADDVDRLRRQARELIAGGPAAR